MVLAVHLLAVQGDRRHVHLRGRQRGPHRLDDLGVDRADGRGVRGERVDVQKIIDPNLSIEEDCCSVAGSYKTVKWGNIYNNIAELYNFSVSTPWKKLSPSAKQKFLYGNKKKWTKQIQ